MAINLTLIDPERDIIADGPLVFNANFSAIQSHINDIENVLQLANKTLKLTNKATIPANSIEADSITLVLAAGNSLSISPDGGASVITLTAAGLITAVNIVASGVGANASTFGDVSVSGVSAFGGQVTINGLLLLTASNSRIATKYRIVAVVDANIGVAATVPVVVTYDNTVYLDYDNGGIALGGNADVKLDTSSLVDGQILKLYCLRKNINGVQKLNNGSVGSEVFAYINPNGSGFTNISSSVQPSFNPQATPNNQSWIKVQWTNIGGGNYRLVVLDSKNVIGVV